LLLKVVPLDAFRCDDFYRIHSVDHGEGWCYCVAWWTPTWDDWSERKAEENRALREQLFSQGQYDGYLLYVNNEPAGWCQCGPRDRLTKLCKEYKLELDPKVWAFTCFVIVPRYRGQGLAHYFLDEILKDLERRGVRELQAFPKRGDGLSKGEVWTGPEGLFQRADFSLEKDDQHRPIYRKQLNQGKRSG
jgi:GNAT superfamily N-acetyltransferase